MAIANGATRRQGRTDRTTSTTSASGHEGRGPATGGHATSRGVGGTSERRATWVTKATSRSSSLNGRQVIAVGLGAITSCASATRLANGAIGTGLHGRRRIADAATAGIAPSSSTSSSAPTTYGGMGSSDGRSIRSETVGRPSLRTTGDGRPDAVTNAAQGAGRTAVTSPNEANVVDAPST